MLHTYNVFVKYNSMFYSDMLLLYDPALYCHTCHDVAEIELKLVLNNTQSMYCNTNLDSFNRCVLYMKAYQVSTKP